MITPKIRAIAKELGISDAYTETLTSVWMTRNHTAADPKASDIKALVEQGKQEQIDYFLAVPVYETINNEKTHVPGVPMLSISSLGTLVLNPLPKENPMDYFFSELEADNTKNPNKHNIEMLRNEIQNPLEAYQYLLWRAQAVRQHNLRGDNSEQAFTTINEQVYDKLTEYRKQHPISKAPAISQEDLAVKTPTPSGQESQISDEFKNVEFVEFNGGYAQRTDANAQWSDVTLGFAVDFNTAGERRTARAAGNKYISFDLFHDGDNSYDGDEITEKIKKAGLPTEGIKLNISGNGIYTQGMPSQEIVDSLVYQAIRGMMDAGITISEIRSGGQTGVDEAGIKAAQQLGIKAIVVAPRGYTFRNQEGRDINDETAFKQRFLAAPEAQQETSKPLEVPQPKSINYVDISELDGALARTDKHNNIRIAKYFGMGEFFAYIQGNPYKGRQQPSDTSEQKKQVFENLAAKGYLITELQQLIQSTEDAKKLLEYHERSHVAHNDYEAYPRTANGRLDIMHPDAIAIETRATQEAWNQLREDKGKLNTVEEPIDPSTLPKIGPDALAPESMSERAKMAREFNPVERNDRVTMIANRFSEIVDSLVDEKISDYEQLLSQAQAANDLETVARLNNLLKVYRNENKGRKKAIEDYTIEKIVQEMLERYQELANISSDPYTKAAYEKVVKYFEPLLDEAMIQIEHSEDLRIVIEKHGAHTVAGQTSEVIGGTVQEVDQEDKDDPNSDDEEGNRVDANGGWSFKIRQTNPMPTSRQIRQMLSHIQKEGIDGAPETDDLGNVRYVPENYAYSVLMNDLAKSLVTPSDFATRNDDGSYNLIALEAIARKYPWVNQLIYQLEMNPRLVAQFYTNFRKDFISYWMQKQVLNSETGVMITGCIALNEAQALDSTMSDVINNYEMGTILDADAVYAAGNQISKKNATEGIELMDRVLPLFQEAEDEEIDEIINALTKGLRMLGFNTNPSVVKNLTYDLEGLAQAKQVANLMKSLFSEVANAEKVNHLVDENRDLYRDIAEIVGEVSELDSIQSFRQGTKTYYSYSAPNYLDTMIKMMSSKSKFQQYIEENYKKFPEFFRNGAWRNEWLKLLESDENIRYNLDTKDLNTIDGIEYAKWDTEQIYKAFINEYFSLPVNPKAVHQFAYYSCPIFSDSPVAKFIKFKKYTGDFKSQLIPLIRQVVKQEIARITRVRERALHGATPIANYDKHGQKFCFFPQLNALNFDGKNFYQKCQEFIAAKDAKGLNTFIDGNMSQVMKEGFSQFLRECAPYKPSIREALLNNEVMSETDNIDDKLEEFFWNNTFAQAEIIQLTTTDLAFYKDDNGVDFQKRFKEVYAAGNRLFTLSEYGRDTERTVILADEIITSSVFGNIQDALEEAQRQGHLQPRDVEVILNKFKNINIADAQAYRSLSSYRSVLDMMGMWTDEMQATFDRIENGKWIMADFDTVYQTLKPFVYTQLEKPDGIGGIMKVPMLNKNSEAVLLAMYPIFANSMNKSPKLKAINKFMEDHNIDVIQYESAVKVGKQLVVDLSHSPAKLKALLDAGNGKLRKAIAGYKGSDIQKLKSYMDSQLQERKITQDQYNKTMNDLQMSEQEVYDMLNSRVYTEGKINPEVVHEIPYNDYMIQQPTPEHLFDVEAVFGSQFRNLIISDMPDDPNFRVRVNDRDYTKKEIIALYQSLITENLLDDFQEVSGKFTNIEVLQQALLQQVKGNPKYGREVLSALELVDIINPNTGAVEKVFNIPLDNPSTTDKIQELMSAMFKNKITKQYIRGGNCILVSSVGLTKELNLVYDKGGNLVGAECYLPAYSKKLFEPLMVEKTGANGNTYMELDVTKLPTSLRKAIGYRIPTEGKYSMLPLIIKGFLPQQNGSAIMVPADITQIAGSDFDVDKMLLMLPEFKVFQDARFASAEEKKRAWDNFYTDPENADINTAIEAAQKAGFNESLEHTRRIKPDAKVEYSDELFQKYLDAVGLKKYQWVEGVQEKFTEWLNKHSSEYDFITEKKVEKITYNHGRSPQAQSRKARNNMIIDISYSILTHRDTIKKIMHPGNYDKVKRASRLSIITDNDVLLQELMAENNLTPETVADFLLDDKKCSLEYLDDFVENHPISRNPLSLSTFAHFHKQNMAGGMLIGIYANSTTAQAKFQRSALGIKEAYQFTINGNRIDSLHDIVSKSGELISQNCAEFSAASVDNGKDPVLADLRQNTNTAKVTNVMTRAGMTIQEIGLLFSSPVVRHYVDYTGSLDGLADVLTKRWGDKQSLLWDMKDQLQALGALDVVNTYSQKKPKQVNLTSKDILNLTINRPQFDIDELIKDWLGVQGGNVDPESLKDKYPDGIDAARNKAIDWLTDNLDVAYVMNNILKVANDLNDVTGVSRADSPNGAISNTLAGALNQVHKVSSIHRRADAPEFTLVGIDDVISTGNIKPGMSKDEMRDILLNSKMPMLQAFFSLGIDMGVQLMAPYYILGSDYVSNMLEFMYTNASDSKLSDDMIMLFGRELTTFALSKSELFGDEHLKDGSVNPERTYDKKREYYLYEYPAEMLKTLNDNPELRTLGAIKKLRVRNGVIEFRNSGRITPTLRDAFIRDFDQLMYMDNPKAQQLAIDLFMYSYYHDGLRFGPNSFGRFFSTDFLTRFPGFINTLREAKFHLHNGSHFDKFLKQFYASHYREGILPKKKVSHSWAGPSIRQVDDRSILVNFWTAKNRNFSDTSFEVYNLLYIDDENLGGLYALDKTRSGQGKADRCYVKISDITRDNYPRYNANQSAEEMSEYTLDADKVAKNQAIGQKNSYDELAGAMEGSPFEMDDEMFAAFEAEDMEAAMGQLEDMYDADEANAQLDKPLCK